MIKYDTSERFRTLIRHKTALFYDENSALNTWNGGWLETNEVRYVYDGRLVVQERDANNLPKVSYTRGIDLSGTFQGAGGIGGLLARTDMGELTVGDPNASAYYFADGQGNITAMINTNQVVVARYEYDPFGNTIAMSGPLAQANTYRFSSKEWDGEAGLYYYGFRFYDPNLQRWVNRDPMGELGFETLFARKRLQSTKSTVPGEPAWAPNLYTGIGNNPMEFIDRDGRCLSGGIKNALGDIAEAVKSTWKVTTGIVSSATLASGFAAAYWKYHTAKSGWENYNDALNALEKKYGDEENWPAWAQQYMAQWESALWHEFGQAAGACYKAIGNNPATGPISGPR